MNTLTLASPDSGVFEPVPDEKDWLNQAFAGRYVIDGEIGRGGMATVFLARERHPARHVAIKMINPELRNRIGRATFQREIDIVSNLIHPHIVPVFAAGEIAGRLFYVMPYIEGQSLRTRLSNRGKMTARVAIQITRDIAMALDYAHRANVVHRDIKPANILLADGHALVTDFGVAQVLCTACDDDHAMAGLAVGTPGYWSPEQAAGISDLDGRSDIYSLARVLVEMTTGTLSGALQQVLDRALATLPNARYATARDFAEALDSTYADDVTVGPGPAESVC